MVEDISRPYTGRTERSTGYCKENLVPETKFETLTETEPKSLSLSLPLFLSSSLSLSLILTHLLLPPPIKIFLYVGLISVSVCGGKVGYCGRYSPLPTFLGLGSPGKCISRHVSGGVPGGGE